jgi:hypothetical protein
MLLSDSFCKNRRVNWRIACLATCAVMLPGCDQISERAGFPDPAKIEAEGKAIGGACRHAGRGLEDCFRLNKEASKSSVYAGWKEMNEYMVKNNMQSVEPTIPPEMLQPKKKKKQVETTEGESKPEQKAETTLPDNNADKEH